MPPTSTPDRSDTLPQPIKYSQQNHAPHERHSQICERTAFLPAIQSLRGAAALLVLFFHLAIHIDKQTDGNELVSLWRFGDSGVQFFFVLSGFIISYSAHTANRERADIFAYFRRRAIRIYPGYWVLLVTLFILYNVSKDVEYAKYRNISYFLYSLTLLPNKMGQYVGVAWTLSYELFFYAVYSLVIHNRRMLVPVTLVLIALGTVRLTGIASKDWPIRFFLNPNMALFAIGIMAAQIFQRFNLSAWSFPLIVGGVTGFALSAFAHVGISNSLLIPAYDLNVFSYGAASSLLILGAACLPNAIGMRLGASSYALYIIHIPVMAITTIALKVSHLNLFSNRIVAFVTLGFVCQFAAIAFHQMIERPLMSWTVRKTKAWSKYLNRPALTSPE